MQVCFNPPWNHRSGDVFAQVQERRSVRHACLHRLFKHSETSSGGVLPVLVAELVPTTANYTANLAAVVMGLFHLLSIFLYIIHLYTSDFYLITLMTGYLTTDENDGNSRCYTTFLAFFFINYHLLLLGFLFSYTYMKLSLLLKYVFKSGTAIFRQVRTNTTF